MQQQILILSALMAPFLLLLFPLCAAASGQHVTVRPGDDVTLRCEAGDVSILAVEWTRPDLEPQYVLFYRDGNLDPAFQHPSFTGRVELEDRDLKDGDVSLTLKNVTSRDSGTYECRVAAGGSRRRKRAIIKTDPITVIHLEGAPPMSVAQRRCTNEFQTNIYPTLVVTSALLLFPLCAAASDQHVTVHPGDDVTLRCEAGDVSIRAVEWTRPDLEPQYVLFYRDGHFDTTKQHPSFTGRVELEHRELKDGDVSLTLKNVTSRDSGTYECRVKSGGFTHTKRAILKTDPIRVIYLEVRDSEMEHSMGGNTESEHPVNGPFPHGHVGLGGVAVLLVAAAVSVAVWRYKRRSDQRSEQSADDEAGNHQPMLTSAV